MTYRDILEQINNKQITTFCLLSEFKNKNHLNKLPTKHRGLYWIWTNLNYMELSTLKTRSDSKEVPISELVSYRRELDGLCEINNKGFKPIYNGIGGYKKEPPAFGLRERISQECNCNDPRTGTLNILNRSQEKDFIDRWAISFFDFDDSSNKELLMSLESKRHVYLDWANRLEIDWRIQYGTPILNRY